MAGLSTLIAWCSKGQLEEVKNFLANDLASFKGSQVKLGGESPSAIVISHEALFVHLVESASSSQQVAMFEYLWDQYPVPHVSQIPWKSIEAAARHGSMSLAKAFYARDPGFIRRKPPVGPRGEKMGGTQIKIALLHNQLPYVEYLLHLGADLNDGFPEQSPIRATIRTDIDDKEALKRVRFLVQLGAWVKGSGSLRETARIGRFEVVGFLLDNGADPDDIDVKSHNSKMQSALIAAAEGGNMEIARYLLQRGADASYCDDTGQSAKEAAEQNGHHHIARMISEYHLEHAYTRMMP